MWKWYSGVVLSEVELGHSHIGVEESHLIVILNIWILYYEGWFSFFA